MKTKTGGAAFLHLSSPKSWRVSGNEKDGIVGVPVYEDCEGMTLLDYFAGQALRGVLAADPEGQWPAHIVASSSYKYATAMIEERNRIMGVEE